ncbi:MAG: sigma-70 family RNA polymerase sigma factor [Leptospiraceae bacterium]|nr:sigma-70 family RNA polymerase sigma factor [Leptospiraceae bacterium]MBK7055866.1 sigma-70 family RNA polymerase sigma factor [Leptospiraceae bacterium]MBK9499300.1 sigma-70 family RNA polymerase sigma factor [Leptospiraceae bacterium]MBL0266280.1 sigma-70 family RNA polymerase sigma factor [Leptospiraceae bacterium]
MKLSQEEIFDLVQSCAAGDPESLKKFFEEFSEDIYNFPIRVFHLEEDDASEFFIYAYERLKSGKRFHTFVGKSGFKTWLYTVLRNMLIDWQRNKRELKIVSSVKVNSDGVEYYSIENEPDLKANLQKEADLMSSRFQGALSEIKIENRIIFKLAYIYYLNLNEEEIDYLIEKTGFTKDELQIEIIKIRDALSEKEIHSIRSEDKIASIYMNILELKQQQEKEKPLVFNDNLPNYDKVQISINKKYEQRRKLIEKKNKGNFITRTPYRVIAQFLKIPEGGVSISLQRVLEKIQKKFVKYEI